ncbi:MAG: hypothetical protein ACK58J_10315, partial [Planctomyces sp.]
GSVALPNADRLDRRRFLRMNECSDIPRKSQESLRDFPLFCLRGSELREFPIPPIGMIRQSLKDVYNQTTTGPQSKAGRLPEFPDHGS